MSQDWKGLSDGNICPWWDVSDWKQPTIAEMAQIYCWDPQDFQAGGFFGSQTCLQFLFWFHSWLLAAPLFSPFSIWHKLIFFPPCRFLGSSLEMMWGFFVVVFIFF